MDADKELRQIILILIRVIRVHPRQKIFLFLVFAYKNFFDKTSYVVDYVTMFRPRVGLGDNSLIVIRRAS